MALAVCWACAAPLVVLAPVLASVVTVTATAVPASAPLHETLAICAGVIVLQPATDRDDAKTTRIVAERMGSSCWKKKDRRAGPRDCVSPPDSALRGFRRPGRWRNGDRGRLRLELADFAGDQPRQRFRRHAEGLHGLRQRRRDPRSRRGDKRRRYKDGPRR